MPFGRPAGKRGGRNRSVNPARGGHKPVRLAEADYPAIAGATQEKQIGAVRADVVRLLNTLIFFFFLPPHHRVPALRIPLLYGRRIGTEGLPNLHERTEHIRANSGSRRQST